MTIVIGIDVSKDSITCCVLTRYPGNLKDYYHQLNQDAPENFPKFSSTPPKRQGKRSEVSIKSAQDFRQYLYQLQAQDKVVAVLEPTGVHYSNLWAKILEAHQIQCYWVGHLQLGRYRRGKQLPNKTDSADALAMAAYWWDSDNLWSNGQPKMSSYLIYQDEPIGRIREIERQLNNLARVQSPIINYARQLLAWQFPEKAQTISSKTREEYIPPLWAWLAGLDDGMSKWGKTRMANDYGRSIAKELGIEIDPQLRLLASWQVDIYNREFELKTELVELLQDEKFGPYLRAFEQVLGAGNNHVIKARLLTRCYPFEEFLDIDLREVIEYEVKEVKRVEKQRERIDGSFRTIINRLPGQVKRVKRNRSRDMFFSRLGMATRIEQSGDKLVEINHGSLICRNSLWQFVYSQLKTDKFRSSCSEQLYEAYCNLAGIPTNKDSIEQAELKKNQPKLQAKHLETKMMSKVCHLLYKSLLMEFSAISSR